eukprot:TRINITY_DN17290_c0_g3_i1.p1 TRINITY_DN17290_c0_g3~~TRINITY_DN17290_c0_g3_i1.p1  ORF type:complete len:809 (-),score=117.60 TRINITY_DN17290_c0_g3_i1:137-2488(-)
MDTIFRMLAPLLLVIAAQNRVASIKLCHMMYLNADNDLETAIVGDVQELLSNSAFMNKAGYQLHVLIDRHSGYSSDVLTPSYDAAGAQRTSEVQGATQYKLTDGKLKVESGAFSGNEVDMDSAATMESFLKDVVPKCKAAGTDAYFLQGGSHGAGFFGFGGDEKKSRRLNTISSGGRRLGGDMMGIRAMASAIENALKASSIPKLDMIGFDACLMASVSVMKAFHNVSKYLLASEPTEPGHGWDYTLLKADYASAADLGKDIINTFVTSTHGETEHQAPKMLALIDLQKYTDFESKFDALFNALASGITAKDQSLRMAANRAITSALKFTSGVDGQDANGKNSKSATDLGSFLAEFKTNCPSGDSALQTALQNFDTSYKEILTHFKIGSGSPQEATGIHVMLPTYKVAHDSVLNLKSEYFCNKAGSSCKNSYYDEVPTSMSTFMDGFYAKSFAGAAQTSDRCKATGSSSLSKPSGSMSLPTTTTTTAGGTPHVLKKDADGCWNYLPGSLIEDGVVNLCVSSTEMFKIETLVSADVEVGESWISIVIKDSSESSGYYEGIAQIGDAKFEANKLHASFDGYVYRIDEQIVTVLQNGASNIFQIDVDYYPAGVTPVITKTTTSTASRKRGYLKFVAVNGTVSSAISLFVNTDGAYAAVLPFRGGTIVPVLLTTDATSVRFGKSYTWKEKLDWKISGFTLGSTVATQLLGSVGGYSANLLMSADTAKSLDTACYGEYTAFGLKNSDFCEDDSQKKDDDSLISAAHAWKLGSLVAAACTSVSYLMYAA